MHLIPNAPGRLSEWKRHPPHEAHLCILLDLPWVSDGARCPARPQCSCWCLCWLSVPQICAIGINQLSALNSALPCQSWTVAVHRHSDLQCRQAALVPISRKWVLTITHAMYLFTDAFTNAQSQAAWHATPHCMCT